MRTTSMSRLLAVCAFVCGAAADVPLMTKVQALEEAAELNNALQMLRAYWSMGFDKWQDECKAESGIYDANVCNPGGQRPPNTEDSNCTGVEARNSTYPCCSEQRWPDECERCCDVCVSGDPSSGKYKAKCQADTFERLTLCGKDANDKAIPAEPMLHMEDGCTTDSHTVYGSNAYACYPEDPYLFQDMLRGRRTDISFPKKRGDETVMGTNQTAVDIVKAAKTDWGEWPILVGTTLVNAANVTPGEEVVLTMKADKSKNETDDKEYPWLCEAATMVSKANNYGTMALEMSGHQTLIAYDTINDRGPRNQGKGIIMSHGNMWALATDNHGVVSINSSEDMYLYSVLNHPGAEVDALGGTHVFGSYVENHGRVAFGEGGRIVMLGANNSGNISIGEGNDVRLYDTVNHVTGIVTTMGGTVLIDNATNQGQMSCTGGTYSVFNSANHGTLFLDGLQGGELADVVNEGSLTAIVDAGATKIVLRRCTGSGTINITGIPKDGLEVDVATVTGSTTLSTSGPGVDPGRANVDVLLKTVSLINLDVVVNNDDTTVQLDGLTIEANGAVAFKNKCPFLVSGTVVAKAGATMDLPCGEAALTVDGPLGLTLNSAATGTITLQGSPPCATVTKNGANVNVVDNCTAGAPSVSPVSPTMSPSTAPTKSPLPVGSPTMSPQKPPSESPLAPTTSPVKAPTKSPLAPDSPTTSPLKPPTESPQAPASPTTSPVKAPTKSPLAAGSPTTSPVKAPTKSPLAAASPTTSPVKAPTQSPLAAGSPTTSPVKAPTKSPLAAGSPTMSPVKAPSKSPLAAGSPTTSPVVTPPGSPSTAPLGAPAPSEDDGSFKAVIYVPIIIAAVLLFCALAVCAYLRMRKPSEPKLSEQIHLCQEMYRDMDLTQNTQTTPPQTTPKTQLDLGPVRHL